MNTELFRQYLALKDRRATLESEVEEIKDKMLMLTDQIMNELIDNGVDNIKVDGRTIYPKKQLYASASRLTDQLKTELEREGATDLIEEKINGNRLSAFIREYMREKGINELSGLPGWMQTDVSITEKVSLGVR